MPVMPTRFVKAASRIPWAKLRLPPPTPCRLNFRLSPKLRSQEQAHRMLPLAQLIQTLMWREKMSALPLATMATRRICTQGKSTRSSVISANVRDCAIRLRQMQRLHSRRLSSDHRTRPRKCSKQHQPFFKRFLQQLHQSFLDLAQPHKLLCGLVALFLRLTWHTLSRV